MTDLKGVSEIIGKFRIGQRLIVLILILVFGSGTYITISYFGSRNSTKQEERIKQLESNIQNMQITQDGLINQNNKLVLFITELNNMLIEKRNKENNISKSIEQPMLLKSVSIPSGIIMDSVSRIKDSNYPKPTPIVNQQPKTNVKVVKVNDTKFYDDIISKINTQLVENKKVKK